MVITAPSSSSTFSPAKSPESIICWNSSRENRRAIGAVADAIRTSRLFLLEHNLQGADKGGQIIIDGIPYPIKIDIKVCVNEPIPHRDDAWPRNFRGELLTLICNLGSSFSNNLDRFYKGKHQHPIIIKIVPSTILSK